MKKTDLTTEEKLKTFTGRDMWQTHDVNGIPSVRLADGPHGLRIEEGKGLGFVDSKPAVAWPSLSLLACSFDPELASRVGEYLAEECQKEEVGILLAPGVNHQRSPLCGRNFEYFSEDPVLTGVLASAYVNGVQRHGTGTCVKHFAGNSRENGRMTADSIIDERALYELYLKQFEMIVRSSHPSSVMLAYNRLNGIYCCENQWLMEEARQWGFDGVFISDWGAVSDPVSSVRHGLNLIMPGEHGTLKRLKQGYDRKLITDRMLDINVQKTAEILNRHNSPEPAEYDEEEHLQAARDAAAQSAVLLKNNGVLPLSKEDRILLISADDEWEHGGFGSSRVNPLRTEVPAEVLRTRGIQTETGTFDDPELLAVKAADFDAVIILASFDRENGSEGLDRTSLDFSPKIRKTAELVSGVCPNTVFVVQTGFPAMIPAEDTLGAVLYMGLSGCMGASAMADILYGDVNPSGRLAQSWPLSLRSVPCSAYFDKDHFLEQYRESVFSGYRYYETFGVPVWRPFGYGLSYTAFSYRDLSVTEKDGVFTAEVCVKNTGEIPGREIVQFYYTMPQSRIVRPKSQLLGFGKVYLEPDEEKKITLSFGADSLSYYDTRLRSWQTEKGKYEIHVCRHAGSTILKTGIEAGDVRDPYSSLKYEYFRVEGGALTVSERDFEKILERKIPSAYQPYPFTPDTTIRELSATRRGRMVIRAIRLYLSRTDRIKGVKEETIFDSPLRQILMGADGMTWDTVDGIVDYLNGRRIRGIRGILRSLRGK